jgi:hypothetical protein
MRPGNLKSLPVDQLWSPDEQTPSDQAEPATRDGEFRAQQQKIQRLNAYYDKALAELRASLDRHRDESG